MPPQVGDHFVFLTGPKKGAIIKSEDLPMGGPQMQAYPADAGGIVRNGSLLNIVILARVGADGADADTASRMADGVVAYSGVCTHQGCPVNQWSHEKQAFVCSCHASTYDPKHGAEVMFGPAPRPIAGLPLKSDDGVLLVAGPFTRKPGIVKV